MKIGTAIAIYFLIWWTVLFITLPIGVRTQRDQGRIVEGTEPGAPVSPMLRKKAILTTLISTVIFLGFWGIRASGVTLQIALNAIPF
jgi:predicted secreted protein